jgi:hypothetical protein
MNRERKIVVKPEEWAGSENAARRAKIMRDARREARKHLAIVTIIVKDRSGSQVMARIDARYWMFDAQGTDRPPPDFQDILRREKSRENTARLKPPKGLFG